MQPGPARLGVAGNRGRQLRPPSALGGKQAATGPLRWAGRSLQQAVRRVPFIRPQQPAPQQQQQQQQHDDGRINQAAYVVVQEACHPAPARVDLARSGAGTAAAAASPAAAVTQPPAPAAASPVAAVAAAAAPLRPPAPSAADPFAASQQLALARHLSTATNGAAPLSSRLESLSWLVFQCGRAQDRTVPSPHSPAAWLSSTEALALLEQVYLVGGAVAELGVADGVYGGAGGHLASNGQRAVASLDFAALLTRYLGQHGMTLCEEFVGEIPYDWLQAKAIHVASCLETRCTVHRLVFERLIDRVGLEGHAAGHAAAGWAGATIINHNTSSSAAQGGGATAAATAAPVQQGGGGGGGAVQALFFAVIALAGGAVRFVVVFVTGAGGLLARLVALRWLASAAGAVAAVASAARGAAGSPPSPQQPACAAAGGAVMPPPSGAPVGPAVSAGLPGPRSHPVALGAGGGTTSSQEEEAPQPQQQQEQQQQRGGMPYFDVLRPSPQPAAALPAAGPLGWAAAAAAAAGAPLLPHHAALREQRRLAFGGAGVDSFDDDDWGR